MNEENEMDFSEWLRNFRENAGWKIKFIAEKIGVPYQTWLRWEGGKPPAEHWQSMLRDKLESMVKPQEAP